MFTTLARMRPRERDRQTDKQTDASCSGRRRCARRARTSAAPAVESHAGRQVERAAEHEDLVVSPQLRGAQRGVEKALRHAVHANDLSA